MKIIIEAYKIPVGSWVTEEISLTRLAENTHNPLRIVREIKIINEFGKEQNLTGGSYLINPKKGIITVIDSCKLLCWTPTDEELVSYLKDTGVIE